MENSHTKSTHDTLSHENNLLITKVEIMPGTFITMKLKSMPNRKENFEI